MSNKFIMKLNHNDDGLPVGNSYNSSSLRRAPGIPGSSNKRSVQHHQTACSQLCPGVDVDLML